MATKNHYYSKRLKTEFIQKEKIKKFHKKNPEYWYCNIVDVYVPTDKDHIYGLNLNYIRRHIDEDGNYSVIEYPQHKKVKTMSIDEYHQTFCRFDEDKKIWIYVNNNVYHEYSSEEDIEDYTDDGMFDDSDSSDEE
jgi:hypothetical protein